MRDRLPVRSKGKGGKDRIRTKQGKEERRDYGKYFDEKLIERKIFLVRTGRFKWGRRKGEGKSRGRRKFGRRCGERSFGNGITAISPVAEPFLLYPLDIISPPRGKKSDCPSPFPREGIKMFDGGRPIVSSRTVVDISSGLQEFRNALEWRLTGWKLRKREEAESHPDDGGGEEFSFHRVDDNDDDAWVEISAKLKFDPSKMELGHLFRQNFILVPLSASEDCHCTHARLLGYMQIENIVNGSWLRQLENSPSKILLPGCSFNRFTYHVCGIYNCRRISQRSGEYLGNFTQDPVRSLFP